MLGPVARQCSKTAEDSRDETQVAAGEGGGGGGYYIEKLKLKLPPKKPYTKINPQKIPFRISKS